MVFEGVRTLANEIGMVVNEKKTQMLCVHANPNSIVNSYIRCNNGDEIKSTNNLKMCVCVCVCKCISINDAGCPTGTCQSHKWLKSVII